MEADSVEGAHCKCPDHPRSCCAVRVCRVAKLFTFPFAALRTLLAAPCPLQFNNALPSAKQSSQPLIAAGVPDAAELTEHVDVPGMGMERVGRARASTAPALLLRDFSTAAHGPEGPNFLNPEEDSRRFAEASILAGQKQAFDPEPGVELPHNTMDLEPGSGAGRATHHYESAYAQPPAGFTTRGQHSAAGGNATAGAGDGSYDPMLGGRSTSYSGARGQPGLPDFSRPLEGLQQAVNTAAGVAVNTAQLVTQVGASILETAATTAASVVREGFRATTQASTRATGAVDRSAHAFGGGSDALDTSYLRQHHMQADGAGNIHLHTRPGQHVTFKEEEAASARPHDAAFDRRPAGAGVGGRVSTPAHGLRDPHSRLFSSSATSAARVAGRRRASTMPSVSQDPMRGIERVEGDLTHLGSGKGKLSAEEQVAMYERQATQAPSVGLYAAEHTDPDPRAHDKELAEGRARDASRKPAASGAGGGSGSAASAAKGGRHFGTAYGGTLDAPPVSHSGTTVGSASTETILIFGQGSRTSGVSGSIDGPASGGGPAVRGFHTAAATYGRKGASKAAAAQAAAGGPPGAGDGMIASISDAATIDDYAQELEASGLEQPMSAGMGKPVGEGVPVRVSAQQLGGAAAAGALSASAAAEAHRVQHRGAAGAGKQHAGAGTAFEDAERISAEVAEMGPDADAQALEEGKLVAGGSGGAAPGGGRHTHVTKTDKVKAIMQATEQGMSQSSCFGDAEAMVESGGAEEAARLASHEGHGKWSGSGRWSCSAENIERQNQLDERDITGEEASSALDQPGAGLTRVGGLAAANTWDDMSVNIDADILAEGWVPDHPYTAEDITGLKIPAKRGHHKGGKKVPTDQYGSMKMPASVARASGLPSGGAGAPGDSGTIGELGDASFQAEGADRAKAGTATYKPGVAVNTIDPASQHPKLAGATTFQVKPMADASLIEDTHVEADRSRAGTALFNDASVLPVVETLSGGTGGLPMTGPVATSGNYTQQPARGFRTGAGQRRKFSSTAAAAAAADGPSSSGQQIIDLEGNDDTAASHAGSVISEERRASIPSNLGAAYGGGSGAYILNGLNGVAEAATDTGLAVLSSSLRVPAGSRPFSSSAASRVKFVTPKNAVVDLEEPAKASHKAAEEPRVPAPRPEAVAGLSAADRAAMYADLEEDLTGENWDWEERMYSAPAAATSGPSQRADAHDLSEHAPAAEGERQHMGLLRASIRLRESERDFRDAEEPVAHAAGVTNIPEGADTGDVSRGGAGVKAGGPAFGLGKPTSPVQAEGALSSLRNWLRGVGQGW